MLYGGSGNDVVWGGGELFVRSNFYLTKPALFEPPPGFGASVRRDFIEAMGRMGQRFVVILAPDKAFDIDEMAQLCEAALAEAA